MFIYLRATVNEHTFSKTNSNVFYAMYTMHLNITSFIQNICYGDWLVNKLPTRLNRSF